MYWNSMYKEDLSAYVWERMFQVQYKSVDCIYGIRGVYTTQFQLKGDILCPFLQYVI